MLVNSLTFSIPQFLSRLARNCDCVFDQAILASTLLLELREMTRGKDPEPSAPLLLRDAYRHLLALHLACRDSEEVFEKVNDLVTEAASLLGIEILCFREDVHGTSN